MDRAARRFGAGQLIGLLALLFVVVLLALLAWRLPTPDGPLAPRQRVRGEPVEPVVDPNLVLITIDGLRIDHLGVYGSSAHSITPHLDRLGHEGFRFERVVSPVPSTLPAQATLHTGRPPESAAGLSPLGGVLRSESATLAEILSAAGFRTAAFTGAGALGRWTGLGRGFDSYDAPASDAQPATVRFLVERPAAAVIDEARVWIDEHYRARFFMWVEIADPRAPHRAPLGGAIPAPDAYRAEVAYADAQVGRLLDRLAALGVLGNTLVAVTAAHATALGEHGELGSGIELYDGTIMVPLLLRPPGGAARDRSIPEQVRLIDLLPTLLELLDLPAHAGLPGISLALFLDPDVDLPALPAVSQSELLSSCVGGPRLRALRAGGWKLIQGVSAELYDLRRDPLERRDLSAAHPQKLAEMQAALGPSDAAVPPEDESADAGAAETGSSGAGAIGEAAAGRREAVDLEEALLALASRDGRRAEAALLRLQAGGSSPRSAMSAHEPVLLALLGAALRMQGRSGESLAANLSAQAAIVGEPATQGENAVPSEPAEPRGAGSADGALLGLLLSEIGALRAAAGEIPGALAAYRRALDRLPDDGEARVALAGLLLERGDINDAVAEYRAALGRMPGDPSVLGGLGRAYLASGDPAAALVYLREALRSAAPAPRDYLDLARACETLGRDREAARVYREFLQRAPADAPGRGEAIERLRHLGSRQGSD